MSLYLDDGDVRLYLGDALETVRELPDESVDCVVTSPPYWGLRDYGTGEWDGGDPDCDHAESGTPDDPVPPSCRQCGKCGKMCRTSWLGPSTVLATCAKCDSEVVYENVGSTGSWVSERGPKTMAEWKHVAKRRVGVWCKCGATRQDRQMGLEPTPDLFLAGMVELFREIRRVLAPHGTCWVNLGDSYAQSGGKLEPEPLEVLQGRAKRKGYDVGAWGAKTKDGQGIAGRAANTAVGGLKPKDLCGIPWRFALALQADGWWLRSDIIWAKPNPMPESVTDRPTKAHEYVFLLTKQPRYWFDTEAVREPHSPDGRKQTAHIHATDNSHPNYDNIGNGNERWPNGGRNVRSVWQIATQPYPEAHFATYPEELARRCILAGCPTRVCRVCGKPSERIVERTKPPVELYSHNPTAFGGRGALNEGGKSGMGGGGNVTKWLHENPPTTVGWSDCGCLEEHAGSGCRATPTQSGGLAEGNDAGTDSACSSKWRPGVVLDPFIGSGTTAKVARDHQRHAIGIDLSSEYLELAARRLQQLSLLT